MVSMQQNPREEKTVLFFIVLPPIFVSGYMTAAYGQSRKVC